MVFVSMPSRPASGHPGSFPVGPTVRVVERGGSVTGEPRWFSETEEGHSQEYAASLHQMALDGQDLEGEARLLDAIIAPGSRVLDAGCGQGRIAAALHRRGHVVIGVDIDPVLVSEARKVNPGPTYLLADLSSLDLESHGHADPMDAVVCAGNVITFVAPGSEVATLRSLRRHLAPGGICVVGFQVERYALADFDRDLAEAGFVLEQRFATWDLRPWSANADFAVSFLRPGTEPGSADSLL